MNTRRAHHAMQQTRTEEHDPNQPDPPETTPAPAPHAVGGPAETAPSENAAPRIAPGAACAADAAAAVDTRAAAATDPAGADAAASDDCTCPTCRERKRDKAKRGGKRCGIFCIQLAFLAGVCYVGNAVSGSLPIAVPGNICSMAILLTLLISGMIAEEKIALISNFLLKYMPVFFIPAGVTIMTSLPLIQGHIPQFVLVCVLTTVMVFLTTSITVIVVTRLQKYLQAKRAGKDVHLRKVLSVEGDARLVQAAEGE